MTRNKPYSQENLDNIEKLLHIIIFTNTASCNINCIKHRESREFRKIKKNQAAWYPLGAVSDPIMRAYLVYA